ncbi:histidine kinase [Ferruginibacter lapsinanis]|uniref:sensor histidine kinase n=1 Tax=Ferruginibacter lapsinanis TaxID=563172 RepID=UPI001E39A14A|nr:histidine kinase [Ferruginibacter lapsinanis]UEG48922.1 histidine kinase [Ferruginibacter lapsinanis]
MSKSLLSSRASLVAFSAWWLVWSLVQWIVLLQLGVTQLQAITDSLLSNVLLGGSCFLIISNMRYYLPKHEKYWYIITVSFVLSFVWLIMIRAALYFLFKNDEQYLFALKQSSILRYGVGFLMISCISTISLLWYTQQDQLKSGNQQKEIEQLAKDAELFKLRQQLQPHFLFNSLNSISALIGSQPEKARNMIQQLSDFLRGTLKREEHQWNSLHEEIQYLELYLDIEKVRFGHRLQTEIFVEDGVESLQLPALLLQPAVENAIKFGLYDTIGEVVIHISAKQRNNLLEIVIQNPFDEETALPSKGTGFGLASIQRRLFLLFERNDLLKTNVENNIFITTILIPQKK